MNDALYILQIFVCSQDDMLTDLEQVCKIS